MMGKTLWESRYNPKSGIPDEVVAHNQRENTMSKKPKTPMSSTTRVANYRARAARLGWVRREYVATPDEHTQLAQLLKEIRK